jgi:hypothetical protein
MGRLIEPQADLYKSKYCDGKADRYVDKNACTKISDMEYEPFPVPTLPLNTRTSANSSNYSFISIANSSIVCVGFRYVSRCHCVPLKPIC